MASAASARNDSGSESERGVRCIGLAFGYPPSRLLGCRLDVSLHHRSATGHPHGSHAEVAERPAPRPGRDTKPSGAGPRVSVAPACPEEPSSELHLPDTGGLPGHPVLALMNRVHGIRDVCRRRRPEADLGRIWAEGTDSTAHVVQIGTRRRFLAPGSEQNERSRRLPIPDVFRCTLSLGLSALPRWPEERVHGFRPAKPGSTASSSSASIPAPPCPIHRGSGGRRQVWRRRRRLRHEGVRAMTQREHSKEVKT